MSGVGLCRQGIAAAHGVEAPDESGIGVPCFGGGDVFYAVAVPEASGAAEGGEAGFGGYAGSGEDEKAVLWAELHDENDTRSEKTGTGIDADKSGMFGMMDSEDQRTTRFLWSCRDDPTYRNAR